ncbi:MAG: hypothetical protein ACTSV2_14915 [Candidatus Thorarchaeota archaeon]
MMSELEPKKIHMYFLFFILVLILSSIPYVLIFVTGPNEMSLFLDSIFYVSDSTGVMARQLTINTLLNMGIVCSICLYFMIHVNRASRNKQKQSQKIAIFFFLLVVLSLLVLDFESFIQTSPVEPSHLSMFGLLLSYLVIVLYIFRHNCAQVEFPAMANRLARKLMENPAVFLGLLLLVLPYGFGIYLDNFNPNYPISIISFYSSITSIGIINMSSSPTGSVFISVMLGSSPIIFHFIFDWLPQILFVILFLRYKSGYSTTRWFGLGIVLSFIPWTVMFLLSLGSPFAIFPLPLLQIFSYFVLVIEKNSKSVIKMDPSPNITKEDEFSTIIKVPIYKVLISRIKNWGSNN